MKRFLFAATPLLTLTGAGAASVALQHDEGVPDLPSNSQRVVGTSSSARIPFASSPLKPALLLAAAQ